LTASRLVEACYQVETQRFPMALRRIDRIRPPPN
jgi:hypothetical protein